jgi:hypothetical protein
MWDKLRIRDRDRIMGMLFFNSLLAFVVFIFFAMGLPRAALVVGVCFLLILFLMTRRFIGVWLECRSARAPVGPLSYDERLKARAKLYKPRAQQMALHHQPKAPDLSMPFY